MNAILVHAGLSDRGGVTVDVRNLEHGLTGLGVDAVAVGRLAELRRALRERPRSLVHVFGCLPSATIFGALALARLHGRPTVWTPVFHPSRPASWRGYRLLRAMELFDRVAPRAARGVDAVVAATAAEAEHFRRLGAPRVELVPPGVADLGPVDAPARSELPARLALGDGPVVVTIARVNSRKALPFGLRAFRALRARRADATLLLVGPPTGFAAAEPGVVAAGWLEPAEVELALRASTALFVPSLYEGLPRAVVEAWRVGRPAVVTDRVALAPLVADGRGLVVPFGDEAAAAGALASLLDDPGRAARLGRAGRELVAREFLLPALVERTAELYRDLARGSRG